MNKIVIIKYLTDKGIAPECSGFPFLVDAIDLLINQRKTYQYNTMKVYKEVGRLHEKTDAAIERCIRYAIKKAGYDCTCGRFIARSVIEMEMKYGALEA